MMVRRLPRSLLRILFAGDGMHGKRYGMSIVNIAFENAETQRKASIQVQESKTWRQYSSTVDCGCYTCEAEQFMIVILILGNV